MKEIKNQMNILMWGSLIVWLGCLLDLLVSQTFQQVNNLLSDSLQSLFLMIIWRISKRSKTDFIYLLPLQFIIIKIVELIGIKTWASDQNLDIEEWSFNRYFQLHSETHIWQTEFIVLLVFFSPTMQWTLFIYTPCFTLTRLLQLYFRFDFNDRHELYHSLLEIGFNLTFGLILFYATQMRELRNFFDHQDTLKKEQQMS